VRKDAIVVGSLGVLAGLVALYQWKQNMSTKGCRRYPTYSEEPEGDGSLTREISFLTRERSHKDGLDHFVKMKARSIPITLLCGKLGSGKTTMVKNIISSIRDFNLGVIINDFAELNVDSNMVKEKVEQTAKGAANSPEVVELSNGCVCCSLQDGLISAVETMVNQTRGKVDYIVVETSGLTDPVEMVRIIENEIGVNVRLDAVVYLMDADNWQDAINDIVELQHADVVVLNKIDLLADKPGLVKEIVEKLQGRTNGVVTSSTYANVPLERLMDVVQVEPEREAFGRMVRGQEQRKQLSGYTIPEEGGNLVRRSSGVTHDIGPNLHENLDESWQSFVFKSNKPFSLDLFQQNVLNSELCGKLARLKGTVWFAETRHEKQTLQISGKLRFDVVPCGRWIMTPNIAVAGVVRGDESDVEKLKAAFESALFIEFKPPSSELVARIKDSGNFDLVKTPSPGGLALRLTGKKKYGFEETTLRVRFGVYLSEVNTTFRKAINSESGPVIALPTTLEDGESAVVIAGCLNPEEACTMLYLAAEATFGSEFQQKVRLCACD